MYLCPGFVSNEVLRLFRPALCHLSYRGILRVLSPPYIVHYSVFKELALWAPRNSNPAHSIKSRMHRHQCLGPMRAAGGNRTHFDLIKSQVPGHLGVGCGLWMGRGSNSPCSEEQVLYRHRRHLDCSHPNVHRMGVYMQALSCFSPETKKATEVSLGGLTLRTVSVPLRNQPPLFEICLGFWASHPKRSMRLRIQHDTQG